MFSCHLLVSAQLARSLIRETNTRCYSQRLENQKRAVPRESNHMSINPDWCMEMHDIMFFQLSPAHFRPVRGTQRKKIQKSVCSCSSVMVRRWLRKQTHKRRSLSGFWKLWEETAGYEWHETIKSKHKFIILWAQSKSTACRECICRDYLSQTFKTPQKDNMVNNMLVNPFLI